MQGQCVERHPGGTKRWVGRFRHLWLLMLHLSRLMLELHLSRLMLEVQLMKLSHCREVRIHCEVAK